jgi:hypothetical protein
LRECQSLLLTRFFAGSVSGQVAVAAWPWRSLHSPRSVSAPDFSGSDSCGWRGETYLAPPGSLEGLCLCLTSIAWQVAHKRKSGHSRHLTYYSSSVCVWLRRGGDGSSHISLMWYFRSSVGPSALVDMRSDGGVHFCSWSSRWVHFFGRWVPSTSLISVAHLARVRLGGLDGAKS